MYCGTELPQPRVGIPTVMRASTQWNLVRKSFLNHAACMSAGTCAATAEAGRAWLSRQEQQEDELRTTGGRAGGRWPILAFWLLFWENSQTECLCKKHEHFRIQIEENFPAFG